MVPMKAGSTRAFQELCENQPTPDPSWEGLGVGSWSQCVRKSERGLSMNLRWSGVPPLGGCASPNRLKPELHAVGSSGPDACAKSTAGRGFDQFCAVACSVRFLMA